MDKDEESLLNVSFVITGFGRFGSIVDNPTTILVSQLESYIQTHFAIDKIKCQTIQPAWEVSFDNVQNQLQQLHQSLLNDDNDNNGAIVLIHLGVDYKAKNVKLERCGINNATYRIPDEKGYQPQKEVVLDTQPFQHIYETTLPLRQIVTQCQQEQIISSRNNIQMSGDAGRFVCNTTYYTSLHYAQQSQNTIHVLFVHVPPFQTIPKEDQLSILCHLMKHIELQLKKQHLKKLKKSKHNKLPKNDNNTEPTIHPTSD